MIDLDGFGWLLLSLGPLFLMQRALHKELQVFFLLLTRRVDVSLVIFSLLFFPGVFVHEFSHFIMAKLLGARTGSFSLIPQNLGNGRLRLGYVETEEVDFIRDALIGFAPLLTGMLFVGFVGIEKLGFMTLWNALIRNNSDPVIETLRLIISQPNYWVWFYAVVTISSTMMPSPSDRRAWIPLLLAIATVLAVGIVLGFGPFLVDSVGLAVNNVAKSMAFIFGFSTTIQLIVFVPLTLGRRLLNRITGLEVRRT